MAVKTQKTDIAIIAKYDIYFEILKKLLHGKNYAISCFEDIQGFLENEASENCDYVFFPHYSKIIPKEFLIEYNCVGFHTGDLPRDRGGSPIQNKIVSGQYLTKVNAFSIGDSIDTGPIYCHREIDLEFGDLEKIIEKLALLIADMIIEIIDLKLSPKSQKGIGTINKRLGYGDSRINFKELNLKKLFDRIRMVDGFDYPKAFIEIGNFRLTFSNALLENGKIICKTSVEEIKNG